MPVDFRTYLGEQYKRYLVETRDGLSRMIEAGEVDDSDKPDAESMLAALDERIQKHNPKEAA